MQASSLAWRSSGRRNGGRTVPPDSGGRYGLLLLVLVASYLFSAFSGVTATSEVQVVLFAAVLLLALRTSPLPGRWPTLIAIIGLVGSGAAVGASLTGTQIGAGVADLWKALMLLLTVVLIVRRVLARPSVTVQSIYGALSAYLITGLMFAACFSAIGHLEHSPFFADNQPASTQTYQYFSFTTLTTLGYGDFTAAGSGGRAIAVLEALTGQVFLATLVARLVSAYRGSAQPDAPPPGRWPPRVSRDGTRAARRRRRPDVGDGREAPGGPDPPVS
jgi:Ion channel